MKDYTVFTLKADPRIRMIVPSERTVCSFKDGADYVEYQADGMPRTMVLLHREWEARWVQKP